MTAENYCCKMRRHFIVGIVGSRNEPTPMEAVDFYIDIESLTLGIKFCPFCGTLQDNKQSMRIATSQKPNRHE